MTTLKPASLDWALAHVEKFGDTDLFPVPFEYRAIRFCWNELKPILAGKTITDWTANSPRRYVSPKSRFGFRIATQLDPLDTLFYLALVYELGKDIEATRIPRGKKVAFSYRFAPDRSGRMFDPKWSWSAFLHRAKALASKRQVKWVVVTDIADFYPRIYSHPLENALAACTGMKGHVEAIKSLVKGWNDRKSYGIPVGPAPSRLLAELVIDDVDQALRSEGIDVIRYIDDYRMFCASEIDAHRALAFLADALFRMHGLTLQQQKTSILQTEDFLKRYVTPHEDRAIGNLAQQFRALLEGVGIDDPYGELDLSEVPSKIWKEIEALNLVSVLGQALAQEPEPDYSLAKFVMRTLGQLADPSGVPLLIADRNRTYPIFTEVMKYVQAVEDKLDLDKKELGKWFLESMEKSILGHLDFHRLWILQTFAASRDWNSAGVFVRLFNAATDHVGVKRKLVLAMATAGNAAWFRMNKQEFGNMPLWLRRAFLYGARCMPGDETDYWYKSVKRTLDEVETAITKWVQAGSP